MADLRRTREGIIYITHKIDEVFQIADEVTVMRDGRVVGIAAGEPLDRDRLITMMVGRELTQLFPKDDLPTGASRSRSEASRWKASFRTCRSTCAAAKSSGWPDWSDPGRTEVAETLFGLRRPSSGEITIDGGPVRIDSPAAAIERGIAFLTEDRMSSGLFPPLNVHENMEVPF